ncbi:ciliogenesis-associated TTC17-interacting protein isoform X4 [Pongo pygmaeus]|uniref:ciliogenesis-associated TTC17-interacting protein isoform X4 n=1 Tax=Pongo pygmaeus TaxID=9600 RepID=UPI0023E14717|nr:ciliogenesis-associated TTC17-interacting protein isoform X4 [Pongo pygmaeus]
MSSKVYSTGSRAKDHQPSGAECLPLPEANAEAIDFLSSLHEEELQMLFFSETLAMVSDTGEPQGELTIEVQRGKYQEKLGVLTYCLFVHASSRGFLDKMLCGNSLLGYLSEKLELMEQHSQDFIKFLILPMERKTSLLKQDDQLAVTRSIKEGEEVKTRVTSFPWSSIKGFISEAANLVLLRVMAWRRMVPSNARFLTLDTEGKLCYLTYQDLGFQTIQVDHQQAEVFIVEQTVHSEEGIPMSCQYYLLSDGHLAKRIQVGSPGCCIITKMPILREEGGAPARPRQISAAAPRSPRAHLRLPALSAAAPAGGRGHLRCRVLRPLRPVASVVTGLGLLPPAQPFPLPGAGGRRPLGGGLSGAQAGTGQETRGRAGTRRGGCAFRAAVLGE